MDYVEFEAEILPLEIGREVLIAELAELGFESFVNTEKGIQAYIPSQDYNEGLIKGLSIISNEHFELTFSMKTIAGQNWNATWESSFEPIEVNENCVIRAPFHEKNDKFKYDIIIEPKMSFGTGHHQTTHMMVDELLSLDVQDKSVLDMGCGTGVLAILAEMRNAGSVVAIDIDEWAYENTKENVEKNNCHKISVYKGGAELLNEEKFEFILANINRNILLADMDSYGKVLKEGGSILFSGFFKSDVDLITEKANSLGLNLVNERNREDWTMLHFKKS